MAFLNQQERDDLLDKIKDKNLGQIRGTLHGKDPKTRLAYYRNVQEVDKWMTRYVSEGLGIRVTVVERPIVNERTKRTEYKIVEIIVEPTPDNRL